MIERLGHFPRVPKPNDNSKMGFSLEFAGMLNRACLFFYIRIVGFVASLLNRACLFFMFMSLHMVSYLVSYLVYIQSWNRTPEISVTTSVVQKFAVIDPSGFSYFFDLF